MWIFTFLPTAQIIEPTPIERLHSITFTIFSLLTVVIFAPKIMLFWTKAEQNDYSMPKVCPMAL